VSTPAWLLISTLATQPLVPWKFRWRRSSAPQPAHLTLLVSTLGPRMLMLFTVPLKYANTECAHALDHPRLVIANALVKRAPMAADRTSELCR